VTPVPYRGERCEPWMVKEVYKKIAELKGLEEEYVRMRLLKNAKTFYQI
jgi:Tat protein secretion system quality control protein TatD with DNase activity